jgi:hypothetical protein
MIFAGLETPAKKLMFAACFRVRRPGSRSFYERNSVRSLIKMDGILRDCDGAARRIEIAIVAEYYLKIVRLFPNPRTAAHAS